MAKSNISKKPASAAAVSNVDDGINGDEINIVNSSLDQAYATLDLLYSITCDDSVDAIFESLSVDTLSNALHFSLLCIEQARVAANRVNAVAHGH